MKKEFIEPEIDVILLDSEISTDETLPVLEVVLLMVMAYEQTDD